MAKILVNAHQSPKYTYGVHVRKSGVAEPKWRGNVDYVGSCIMGLVTLVIKAENDWRDVGRPSSCNASQLPHFLVLTAVCWINVKWKVTSSYSMVLRDRMTLSFVLLTSWLQITEWSRQDARNRGNWTKMHDESRIERDHNVVILSLIHIWRCRRRG